MQTFQKRQQVWQQLQNMAPLRLAGSWDNVGILVNPNPIHQGQEKVFLTIDLTEAVLEEALAWQASIIIAYHPPIFSGLKQLDLNHSMSTLLVQAIQAGIGIYSPHSALDAVEGGICDWLVQIFSAACVGKTLAEIQNDPWQGLKKEDGQETVMKVPLQPDSDTPHEGAGRLCTLKQKTPLSQILQSLTDHLALDYVRLALPHQHTAEQTMIETVALCPGAGGSLFHQKINADLLFTGEMRHHDVLAHSRKGRSVILTEHTRCERGYLPLFAKQIEQNLSVEVKCSTIDDDPLHIWQP